MEPELADVVNGRTVLYPSTLWSVAPFTVYAFLSFGEQATRTHDNGAREDHDRQSKSIPHGNIPFGENCKTARRHKLGVTSLIVWAKIF
jgi:hypothetical protein